MLAAVSSRAIARTIWKPFLVQAVRANDRGLAFSFVQALTRSNVILNPEDYACMLLELFSLGDFSDLGIMRRLAGDLQYVFAVWRLVEEKHGTLTPLILYESMALAHLALLTPRSSGGNCQGGQISHRCAATAHSGEGGANATHVRWKR